MEIDHIKEFLTLAQGRNYSQAAEDLFISQSSLTKHIIKMENDLGFKLFVRTNPLTLTPAGSYLYDELKPQYEHYLETIDKARQIKNGISGTISMGFGNYSKSLYAPDVKLFQKAFPNIQIKMSIKDQNDLLNDLMDDMVDIATLYSVHSTNNKLLSDYARLPIVSGKMGLLVHKDDTSFKDAKEVSITSLKKRTYIMIDNPYYRQIHSCFDELCAKYNVRMKNIVLVPTLEDALLYVIMYGGCLFVPGGENTYGPDFKKIELMEKDYSFTRYYVWKMSNTNTAIVKFAKIARDRRAEAIKKDILLRDY